MLDTKTRTTNDQMKNESTDCSANFSDTKIDCEFTSLDPMNIVSEQKMTRNPSYSYAHGKYVDNEQETVAAPTTQYSSNIQCGNVSMMESKPEVEQHVSLQQPQCFTEPIYAPKVRSQLESHQPRIPVGKNLGNDTKPSAGHQMYVQVLPTEPLTSNRAPHLNHSSKSTLPKSKAPQNLQEVTIQYADESKNNLHDNQYEHMIADISLPSELSSSSIYGQLGGPRKPTSASTFRDNARRQDRMSGYLCSRISWSRREEQAATCLQRWWRIQRSLIRLRQLHSTNAGNITTIDVLTALAPCLPLLPLTPTDLRTEKQLQTVRSAVSRCLRVTSQLQEEVDQLDLQIGLLLSNTMSIQDSSSYLGITPATVSCSINASEVLDPLACVGGTNNASSARKNSIKKDTKETERRGTMTAATGLKALRKCSRERLQGYQQLFYLLQTEPRYLATLIFALLSVKNTHFVEGVVFSLYNYGANDRDNFLLINLFKTALEEEIRCKVLRISDIVSGEPLVIKMIVSFVRKGPCRAALREILGPLVTQVLKDPQLNLNTNPVEIYQNWLNEIEMETGCSSGSPYNVSAEEALKHTTVATRLQNTLTTLTRLTSTFCNTITSSIQKLPYALLYLAGVMRKALSNRFPHILDKEILKVVGSLIYYRYINSAIVAPDAFDVISVSPGEQLNSRQRRNLATIAKTLQAAATKRGFGNDTPYLCSLNTHLVTWHESLRQFFDSCCRVPGPDAVFAVTQYSEAALIFRPQIHITLQKLYETHCLVLENRTLLAPDAADPLHAVLNDLPLPDLPSMGDPTGKTEVYLTLTNKFGYSDPTTNEVTSITKDSHTKLFDKSKQLVVDVLLCYTFGDRGASPIDWSCVTLQSIVSSSTFPAQEKHYALLKTIIDNTSDTLHAAKTRLSHNLRRLQTLGLANPQDGFLSLLRAVTTDVLSQRNYRTSRSKELSRLSLALAQLQEKEQFMRDQRQSYITYLTTCRANMMQCFRGKARRRGNGAAVTYSGKKLVEKGVLVSIKDFSTTEYSGAAFVFSRADPLYMESIKSKSKKAPSTPSKLTEAEREERQNRSNADRGIEPINDDEDDSGTTATATNGGLFSVTVKYRGVVVDTIRISIQVTLRYTF